MRTLDLGWIEILVPDWATYMSIDESGAVFIYLHEPLRDPEAGCWDISNNLGDKFQQIMLIPGIISDWDEHLYILEDVPSYQEQFQQVLGSSYV